MNSEMIEIIEALETKDEMREFARETFGIDFKARETVESMREQLLTAVQQQEGSQSSGLPPEDAPSSSQQQEEQNQPEDREPSTQQQMKPNRRLLRNTKNGRVFPFNARLAKLKHMTEV